MAGCSILCSIHSADETQPGRNSCPEFAIFGFQFGLYHVVVMLTFSFLRSVSLAAIVYVTESVRRICDYIWGDQSRLGYARGNTSRRPAALWLQFPQRAVSAQIKVQYHAILMSFTGESNNISILFCSVVRTQEQEHKNTNLCGQPEHILAKQSLSFWSRPRL